MTTTYYTKYNGDTHTVTADWNDASSPMLFDGSKSPGLVEDFCHYPSRAMRYHLEEICRASGFDPYREMYAREIHAAVWGLKEQPQQEEKGQTQP